MYSTVLSKTIYTKYYIIIQKHTLTMTVRGRGAIWSITFPERLFKLFTYYPPPPPPPPPLVSFLFLSYLSSILSLFPFFSLPVLPFWLYKWTKPHTMPPTLLSQPQTDQAINEQKSRTVWAHAKMNNHNKIISNWIIRFRKPTNVSP